VTNSTSKPLLLVNAPNRTNAPIVLIDANAQYGQPRHFRQQPGASNQAGSMAPTPLKRGVTLLLSNLGRELRNDFHTFFTFPLSITGNISYIFSMKQILNPYGGA
tara:strand:- start:568 stop:882 length:315 start_codon:yes stop_codon:yes gene_type:complete